MKVGKIYSVLNFCEKVLYGIRSVDIWFFICSKDSLSTEFA